MAASPAPDYAIEIAELRRQIESLTNTQRSSSNRLKRNSRRPLAIAGISVLALGTLAGAAGASGSTTNVTFVPLTPAHTLVTNGSITAHKTLNEVVIGGSTTVPSNATTVELQVTAKGTAAGSLAFYPTSNVSGGSGQTLAYPSGTSTSTATVDENVGMSGEVTIYNAGSGTATVTAKIIGYSTQVTAADISPADGTSGQVLTNTGAGASWATLPKVSASAIDGSGGSAGQILTNNGSGGATWTSPSQGQVFVDSGHLGQVNIAYNSIQTVASVAVPAGTYNVVGTYVVAAPAPGIVNCWLESPPQVSSPIISTPASEQYGGAGSYYGSGVVQIVTPSSGPIYLNCQDKESATVSVNSQYLTATRVN